MAIKAPPPRKWGGVRRIMRGGLVRGLKAI